MKNPLTLAIIIGMASCAAPKAIVIEEAPVKPKGNAVAAVPEPRTPSDPNDGLRLPDMLTLPDDSQLRSASNPSGNGDATVITRPPKE